VKQDKRRGKRSRVAKTPGSWEWLLGFREHAGPYHAALAHFMFVTGRRVGQSVAMHPDALDLDKARARVPGAKGHDDEWVDLTPELVSRAKALPAKRPRGWERTRDNLARVRLCRSLLAAEGLALGLQAGGDCVPPAALCRSARLRAGDGGQAARGRSGDCQLRGMGGHVDAVAHLHPRGGRFAQDSQGKSYRARTSRETYGP
jgi:hypothetical protein